jgi:hypothetical protein
MFLRKTAIVLVVVAVVVAGAFMFFARGSGRALFSDPAAQRTSPEYRRFTSGERSSELLSPPTNIVVERSESRVVMRIPGPMPQQPENFFATEVRRTSGTNAIQFGEGSVWLAGIGVGYAAPKTNFDYSVEVRAKLYAADLRPLAREEESAALLDWRWNGQVNAQGMFPQARFIFATTNLTEFKALSAAVFDAPTRQPLMNSYGYAAERNTFCYEGEIGLWHQTPLEIGVTIAIGPTETFSMEPKENAELRYPGGFLKLVAIADGGSGGFSSSSDGRTNVVSISLGSDTRDDRASFVFLSWPTASDLPLDIELLDDAGKPLPNYGSSSGSNVLVPSVRGAADEVKEIRIKYYPKVYRIIFKLPELPGLPEENRDLKNLFDARVPYMRLQQQWSVDDALRRLTQMNIFMGSLPLNPTNIYYPIIYTNRTTRDIFEDVAHHLADPQDRLKADAEKNQIEVARPPLALLLDQVKKLLR